MKMKEDIRPISYLKAHAADILEQVNNTRRPIFVTQNGEARAVVLDTESFENMQNALSLLKVVSQGEKNIRDGKYKTSSEVFSVIEKKLKK